MKVAICNENERDSNEYRDLIEEIAKKHEIGIEVTLYQKGDALFFAWEDVRKQSDVVFLEASMTEKNGIEVAQGLRERGYFSDIVFLTNDEHYVFDAFDVEAYHYIVKEKVEKGKLEEVFLKVYERWQRRKREYITVKAGGEGRNIALREIAYFEIDGNMVTVHYSEKETFNFYSTLSKIENALHSRGFIRIHRYAIVNVSYIKIANSKGVEMMDGTRFPISREGWRKLKEHPSSRENSYLI